MNNPSNSDIQTSKTAAGPAPQAAKQRRASDTRPTIDSVRDLLLGDTISESRRELTNIERKTHDQMGELRVELGDRIDRIVRALSTVNQAVHKELGAREQAVRESSEAISTQLEDRVSFLEAKIYTVVADMERKVNASHTADNDKLVEQLKAANARTEAGITELTEKFEQQISQFGERIADDIAKINDKVAVIQGRTADELEAAGSKLGEQLGLAESRFKSELGTLRKELDKSTAQMRKEVQDQASEQRASISRSEASTRATLRDHLDQLEGRKVSRNDFSTLLHELASRMDASDEATDSKEDKKDKKGKK